jgi:GNAT superfamily N-acetyltransferase
LASTATSHPVAVRRSRKRSCASTEVGTELCVSSKAAYQARSPLVGPCHFGMRCHAGGTGGASCWAGRPGASAQITQHPRNGPLPCIGQARPVSGDALASFQNARAGETLCCFPDRTTFFGRASRARDGGGRRAVFSDRARCRGRGLLHRLRETNVQEARLWTLTENHRARAFYERRGWSLTGRTRVVPYPPYPIDVEYARSRHFAASRASGDIRELWPSRRVATRPVRR